MNCQQCNCPNEPDARFCKNCGTILNYNLQPSNPYLHTNYPGLTPDAPVQNEPTLKYFYILLSFDVFRTFLWLIINVVFIRVWQKSSSDNFSWIYEVYSWGMNIILVILIILFAVLIKNKSAKIFIILYGVISLLLVLGFRFWN
ncbi:hypothetical protein BH11BAC7_BH11BAC7_12200 [soil metagenome]